MIAGIAHLRGYDLDDPRVSNAVLACLLGEDDGQALVSRSSRSRRRRWRWRPLRRTTRTLDQIISAEVAADLIAKVAGKRLAGTVGRRIPVVGGLVGAGADGFATWRVGRYADRELLPRARR